MSAIASTHTLSIVEGLMVKTFVDDARGEPEREWAGLTLLNRNAPGLVPEPISRNPLPPSVTMTVVPGRPLSGHLTDAEVDAIGSALRLMMAAPTASDVVRLPSGIGPDTLNARARTRLSHGATPVTVDDVAASARCFLDEDTYPAGTTTPCFGRADHNLANFLYDGMVCRLVDFEDSGASDRGTEYALLLEHISARETTDRQWLRLVAAADLDDAERDRMLWVRRCAAIFWFTMLLPGGPAASRNPPGTLNAQADRVRELLRAVG